MKPALLVRTVELRGEVILYKGIPEIIVQGGNQLEVVEE